MTTSAPADVIEEAIRTYLDRGLAMGGEVRQFMEATFGDAGPETLRSVLDDPSGAERDSVLDLVFFPDLALQVAIEPLLGEHSPKEADITRLATRLRAVPATTQLLFPGAAAAIPLAMPAFAVDAFLARLHLGWQPVPALAAVLEGQDLRWLSPTQDPLDGRLRLQVRLRNADLSQPPLQVDFLGYFLERCPAGGGVFVDQLDFILVFLKEHEAASNLYQALMARKAFLLRHLQKARRAAEFAARNNQETLMMTGVRRPFFDTAAAERTVALIDTVAVAVYGRTEWLEGALCEIDLGHSSEGFDPAELIRRLS